MGIFLPTPKSQIKCQSINIIFTLLKQNLINYFSLNKNFQFDPVTKSFIIGEIILNPTTQQKHINSFGFEYYNDYQDKYIYTLKQRLIFDDYAFKVTVVFKSDTIWLIEIAYEMKELVTNEFIKSLYQTLYQTICALNISDVLNVELRYKNSLSLEFN